MADLNSSEKAQTRSPEKVSESRLTVTQPPKMKELGQLLETLEGLTQRVSERTGEDSSSDMGSGGSSGSSGGQRRASPRDAAIALMPAAPAVLQQKLAEHIEGEIKRLEESIRKTRSVTREGGAFELNELYSRMRKLRGLMREILQASVDLLKRLFIRVFIDKQPLQ